MSAAPNTAADFQLVWNIATLAEGVKSLDEQRNDAYIAWLRLDHCRLVAAEEGKPMSMYLDGRIAEARSKYEELRDLTTERLNSGLAWMEHQLALRAERRDR